MKKIFHYEIKSLLGIGAFSNVFLAYDTKNKINVAIKRIQKDLNHAQDYKDFYKEIKSMSEIQSNHSVKFYDAFQKDEYYYIVSELCDENFENYLEYFQMV
jgi:serine/threonine protein kinase